MTKAKSVAVPIGTSEPLSNEIGEIHFGPDPVQKFFEELAASTRVPHYADKQREWVRQLLNRATEAGLYHPEQT